MAETWVLNEGQNTWIPPNYSYAQQTPQFISNGMQFYGFVASGVTLIYFIGPGGESPEGDDVIICTGEEDVITFVDQAYRTLTFDTAPTGDLLTWLQANGVKQQSKPANKVVVNGETILDLTQDTVTPATLAKGITAHDKSGAPITGTMEASAGGDYNIAATTNSDGTQNLAITDAGGGSSGGSGVQWVPAKNN